jgi:hypothetical protein
VANALTAIAEQFSSTELRDAIDANWSAAGLPTLGAAILTSRRLLRERGRYPALAVELGEVSSRSEGSGGLRSMRGEATYTLTVGAADEPALLARLQPMLDGLRQAVETTLADGFQLLAFCGTAPEGERETAGGVPVRTTTLRFSYCWLYEVGTV